MILNAGNWVRCRRITHFQAFFVRKDEIAALRLPGPVALDQTVITLRNHLLTISKAQPGLENMSGVVAIAEIIALTKKKLRKVGATSEATAKTPKELGLNKTWLNTSKTAGVIATKEGKYYLKSR
jgi:hypothetical protein